MASSPFHPPAWRWSSWPLAGRLGQAEPLKGQWPTACRLGSGKIQRYAIWQVAGTGDEPTLAQRTRLDWRRRSVSVLAVPRRGSARIDTKAHRVPIIRSIEPDTGGPQVVDAPC
jgi:hypothetical protein